MQLPWRAGSLPSPCATAPAARLASQSGGPRPASGPDIGAPLRRVPRVARLAGCARGSARCLPPPPPDRLKATRAAALLGAPTTAGRTSSTAGLGGVSGSRPRLRAPAGGPARGADFRLRRRVSALLSGAGGPPANGQTNSFIETLDTSLRQTDSSSPVHRTAAHRGRPGWSPGQARPPAARRRDSGRAAALLRLAAAASSAAGTARPRLSLTSSMYHVLSDNPHPPLTISLPPSSPPVPSSALPPAPTIDSPPCSPLFVVSFC